ncbi:class I SAM-dependent methyltransferase [Ensifer adhaerens]|uniref:class I SAM-dependent methyltransferase n=1 Tax=Ensifer adhaerens TaxID=106592 RepID=UPI001CBAF1B9|nr:class I SAM-dependent methyltransferase [Ensifer adhaerens]UAX95098.1 class I SAM-dependent methyltransferase [Ensifer adhaerens]UAY03010.1 class I SAM-dependent methyltransferase [Ensifer adhaerens]UAY10995.1 class I SAM-dependent methyltransferase [Ensifer adhaerens]
MFGLKKFRRRTLDRGSHSNDQVFGQYSHETPRHQNAIDALPGWNSAFPAEFGLKAGNHPLFADSRIIWAVEQAGPLKGKRVLEIGPLEGMHTYMLSKQGPASIDAIEANKGCFLRCLVSKEVLGIERVNFYLGDAIRWLEETQKHYDLVVASGVLYHMADPGLFLSEVANHCDSLFLWTHYFDDNAMPVHDSRRQAFSGNMEIRTYAGLALRYFERGYHNANTNDNFCGGMKDRHYWMHRDDIISLLAALGFGDIRIGQEDLTHGGGPCFSLYAKRTETIK